MIGAIIGLILLMIVLGVMIWGGKRLVALIPLDEPFKNDRVRFCSSSSPSLS